MRIEEMKIRVSAEEIDDVIAMYEGQGYVLEDVAYSSDYKYKYLYFVLD